MAADLPTGSELGFVTPRKDVGRDLETVRTALEHWLRARLPDAADLHVSTPFPPEANGIANETLIFATDWRRPGSPDAASFVARLKPRTSLFPAVGVDLQCRMYEALAEEPGVPVPAVVGYEADPSHLGVPFFVMDRVEGLVPSDRPHYSFSGWVAEATPTQRRSLWESSVKVLAALSEVDVEKVAFLHRTGDGTTGLEQSLHEWRTYYDDEADGRQIDVMERGYEWLRTNLPAEPPTGLAWGDARISNLVYRDFTCVAVLDWDMVSLAGGETDLGWWILQDQGSARRLPGIGSLVETVELWEELTGRHVVDMRWSVAFNAFRLGAIRARLARQMAARGEGTGADPFTNVAVQQLALLLDLTPPAPLTASLPDYPF